MTPGPWEFTDDYADEGICCVKQSGLPFYCMVAEFMIDDESGDSEQEIADAKGTALLRNRVKALCGMVRILHDALVTTKSGMGGVDTDIANTALSAVALIAN